MRGMTLAVVALLAAALLAGCGGDDEEGLAPGVWVAWAPREPGEAREGGEVIRLVHEGGNTVIELPEGGVYGLHSLSPAGTRLAAVSIPIAEDEAEPTLVLQLLELPGGRVIRTIELDQERDSALNQVVWSPDGTRLLALHTASIQLRDQDGELIARTESADTTGLTVARAWAPDSTRALVWTEDGFVLVRRDGQVLEPVALDELDESPDAWFISGWPSESQVSVAGRILLHGEDGEFIDVEGREYTLTLDDDGLVEIGGPAPWDSPGLLGRFRGFLPRRPRARLR